MKLCGSDNQGYIVCKEVPAAPFKGTHPLTLMQPSPALIRPANLPRFKQKEIKDLVAVSYKCL